MQCAFPLQRDEEITYAELAHKEPSCPVVNRLQPATEYAELDFQRRLGAPYPWPSSTHEEALRSSLDAGEFPLISGASRRSKVSYSFSFFNVISANPVVDLWTDYTYLTKVMFFTLGLTLFLILIFDFFFFLVKFIL